MASVNKAIIVGNLGADPEVRYASSGDAIASLSVATKHTYKDKSGEKQEKTEWHRVSMFGKVAEIAGQYLKRGSQVYIEGRLQTRKWTDKSNIERYTTEIIAEHMQMLGGKPDHQSDSNERNKTSNQGNNSGFDDMDSDVPF